MQVVAAGRRGTHDRPQIFGAGRDQSRRQDAFFDQPVAPIDIGDGFLEQLGALHEPGADRRPFGVFDKQRHMPFSSTKPRISSLPFSPFSFAQTTNTSAIGALEIHIFEPEIL